MKILIKPLEAFLTSRIHATSNINKVMITKDFHEVITILTIIEMQKGDESKWTYK